MSDKRPAHLRVLSDGLVGNRTRVFYVSAAGVETEISDVVTGLEFRGGIAMGEITKVEFAKVLFDVSARGKP